MIGTLKASDYLISIITGSYWLKTIGSTCQLKKGVFHQAQPFALFNMKLSLH